MRKTSAKGIIILLLTALIWGSSFVAQSVGMEDVQALTFNGIRTLLGALVLLLFILIRQLITTKSLKGTFDLKTFKRGLILGTAFFFASNLQQFAFYYSTAGKIAFITALYMFFVPVLGLFLKRRVSLLTWFCVLAGIVGLYLLSVKGGDFRSINKGDLLALGCAFVYAIHILLVDKFSQEVDGIKLSCMQFAVAGTATIILMFIFEAPTVEAVRSASIPLLYSGIMSCGLAYTFQIIGQRYTNPVVASLLMCMESVFAVLAAALILKETLTLREGLGCTIMFIAIIVSQLAELKKPDSEAA